MVRKIIHIDEEKCNGCGVCTTACHEGAIEIINGKAKLVREHFCDGLGDCLPGCPMGAITFEEREAPAYDEEAVLKAKQEKEQNASMSVPHTGCPGTRILAMNRNQKEMVEIEGSEFVMPSSQLRNWPIEIMTTRQTGGLLAPIRGSYRPAPKDAGFHFVQALMPLTRRSP